MNTTKPLRETRVGDAAVEGLLNGILAGIAMAAVIIGFGFLNGIAPLTVLQYFDVTGNTSPLTGILVHLAVAGVYGVAFGLIAFVLARVLGARMNRVGWLALGAVYGLIILGIAQGIILPRAALALEALPFWTMAAAHIVYGLVLAGLQMRGRV